MSPSVVVTVRGLALAANLSLGAPVVGNVVSRGSVKVGKADEWSAHP